MKLNSFFGNLKNILILSLIWNGFCSINLVLNLTSFMRGTSMIDLVQAEKEVEASGNSILEKSYEKEITAWKGLNKYCPQGNDEVGVSACKLFRDNLHAVLTEREDINSGYIAQATASTPPEPENGPYSTRDESKQLKSAKKNIEDEKPALDKAIDTVKDLSNGIDSVFGTPVPKGGNE